jgi:putative aminopeptidase FrvX
VDSRAQFLKQITEASGVPGYEGEVRAVIRQRLADLTTIEQDKIGSIICKKAGASESPRVMLAGHIDEVGFMVRQVTKQGYVKFLPLGGWWDQVLLAQQVVIRTSQGDVWGLIGAKPPHILSDDERKKVVEKKDMYIDVGATSQEEVEALGVRPGDPIIPACDFRILGSGQAYLSKAWDNRIGCALFIEVIEELARSEHPNTVYGVGTVQEEVGLRGATTSPRVVDPDVALILEVDIASDLPGLSEDEPAIALGKGPSLLVYDASMIPNRALRDLVIETAKELDIPLQLSSMARGGTDGGRIHIHAAGVPAVVVGVPTRHIHSHAGILHRRDYDQALELVVAVVKKLDEETVRGLTM